MIVGYVRVSDNEQNEALQVDALKSAGCERIFCDHGVSGTQSNRNGLNKALAALAPQDTLVVWKLDRLGRSSLHLLKLLDQLTKQQISFRSLTEGVDSSTTVGRLAFSMLAAFAEYERELISERTKAGMKAAKKRGVHVGRPRKQQTRSPWPLRWPCKELPKKCSRLK